MATRSFDATSTPTNIVSALSLSAGPQYVIQNVDTLRTLKVYEGNTAPEASDRAFVVESLGLYGFDLRDFGVWVWTSDEGECKCVIRGVGVSESG